MGFPAHQCVSSWADRIPSGRCIEVPVTRKARRGTRYYLSLHSGGEVMRWIEGLIAVLALLLAVRWTVMHLVLAPDCSNNVITQTPSPDNRHFAVVFDRACGASTSNDRIVMLREDKETLKLDNYTEWIFTAKHEPRIELRWTDATHLVVSSDSNDESPEPSEQWRDVSIIRVREE